ncbi:MAG: hypothetical protein AAB572_01510 [Patescibacteria group bacterium]
MEKSMLVVSKEVFFPTKETLSLAKEKINLKRPPNENSGRKCRALRNLVSSNSEFNIPDFDDDEIVFCHDPHRYVSDDDIPDQDNFFSEVEEKIDRELASKKNKTELLMVMDEGLPLAVGEAEKTFSFFQRLDSFDILDILEEQMGNIPHIASFHKFPSYKRKRNFGG